MKKMNKHRLFVQAIIYARIYASGTSQTVFTGLKIKKNIIIYIGFGKIHMNVNDFKHSIGKLQKTFYIVCSFSCRV